MDTHWDEVTLFGKLIERGGKAQKGDLVHITGRVRQNSYDTDEGRRYTVELIADGFAVLANGLEERDSERDRKRVVSGKRVAGREDLGRRRIESIKNNNKKHYHTHN